jgi:hypothetical protein
MTNIVSACGTKDKDKRNFVMPEAIAPIPKKCVGPSLARVVGRVAE